MRSLLVAAVTVALALQPVDPGAPAAAQPTAPPSEVAAPALGPAYDDDASLPAHAVDVVDYTLRASLDPGAHTVHGDGTITWRNTSSAPVKELWVHLYLNAFKNEHSAFLRERVGGRGSTTPEDWGWIDVQRLVLRAGTDAPVDLWPHAELHRPGDDDETDARVPLPRAVAPGETIALDVGFDDRLPMVVERTGYRGTFHMIGQWFPKIARLEPDGRWAHFPFHHLAEFYADYGTYDVTLDVPAGYVIGATGPVAERREAGGRVVERHVQADVHDFAWTAWDKWQAARETIDGVKVTLLYPRGFLRVAARDMAALRFALPYLSARYGRYPYEVLTVAHPQSDVAEAGGMEYPTFITTDGPWWTPPGVRIPEIVTVHELSHQWFYGLVGTNEEAWPMLDEGLTQFAEVDAMGKWRGEGSAGEMLGLRVSDAAIQAAQSNARATDEPVAQPADAFSTGGNYGSLVYSRTATVLETVRRVYGDEALGRALGRYARRYRFQHPGPGELLDVFGEVLGAPVKETLQTAFFDRGWVDYVVERATARPARRAGGMFEVAGERKKVEAGASDEGGFENSVLVRRRGTLVFPVEIQMTMADGTTRLEHWDGEGDFKRFTWRDPVALRSAIVDPGERVLVDASTENNRAVVDDGGGPGPRTLERVIYFAQLALQAVAP